MAKKKKKRKSKDRMIKVKLIDARNGKPILNFRGLVVKKEQREGKFGGDVDKDLYVRAWQIRIAKGTRLNSGVPYILNYDQKKNKKKK